jgi:mRNA interferase YafQ
MKRALVRTPSFNRAFRKFVRRQPELLDGIERTLQLMEIDVFAPSLGTHKLSGELLGLRACSCGYNCRILFSIDRDPRTQAEILLLHNIGTHDQVY